MYFAGSLFEKLTRKRERVAISSVTGTLVQLSLIRLETGETTDHAHFNEQMGYVLSGEVKLTIDGEKRICLPGDACHVPANIPHGFRVLDDRVEYIEVFAPPKDENT
jgi:quercetin dioxygenase-like cupin family protein